MWIKLQVIKSEKEKTWVRQWKQRVKAAGIETAAESWRFKKKIKIKIKKQARFYLQSNSVWPEVQHKGENHLEMNKMK